MCRREWRTIANARQVRRQVVAACASSARIPAGWIAARPIATATSCPWTSRRRSEATAWGCNLSAWSRLKADEIECRVSRVLYRDARRWGWTKTGRMAENRSRRRDVRGRRTSGRPEGFRDETEQWAVNDVLLDDRCWATACCLSKKERKEKQERTWLASITRLRDNRLRWSSAAQTRESCSRDNCCFDNAILTMPF